MADTEREAFELWARQAMGLLDSTPLDWELPWVKAAFYGWKAGRAALASRPAEVDDWISVEDRMPTDSLIKFLVTGVAAAGGPLGVHMAELRGGSLYFHEGDMKGGCDPCIDDVVTHWMPLPAAPSHTTNKENGGADGHVLDR